MSTEPFKPKPKRKRRVRETGKYGTEAAGRKNVRARGGESLKWVSPGHNGVPDQIEFYDVEQLQEALTGYGLFLDRDQCVVMLAEVIRFTEYKRPKGTTTENQDRVHEMLRSRGFTVNIVDRKLPKDGSRE